MNEGKLKLDRAFEGTNYTGDIGKYGVRLCKQNEDDKNTYITPGSRDWAKINYTDGKNIHYRVMQNYSGVSGFEFSEQEQPGLKKMGINDFNSEYNTVLLRDLVKDSVYARHLTDTEINHIINDVIRSSKIANEVPGVKQEDHTSNIKEVSGSDLGKILYGYTPATGGLPFSMIAEQFKDFKFAVTEAVGNTESAADMQAQQKLISSGMGKHRIFTFTKNEGGNTHVVKVEIHK
jgi:hypothetical protein